jgi:hypothetical protein
MKTLFKVSYVGFFNIPVTRTFKSKEIALSWALRIGKKDVCKIEEIKD